MGGGGGVKQEVEANDSARPIAQPGGLLGNVQLVHLFLLR